MGELLLACASLLLFLLVAEAAARVWVVRSWPADKVAVFTEGGAVRGRFAFDPELGYTLAAHHRSWSRVHNRHGYRGPDFELRKPPATLRVVMLGGSTVYAPAVAEEETSAQRLEARLAPVLAPRRVEVVNAGVPGWTSRETRMQLAGRVLALEPDAVVILDGRNEVFPQLWRGYRDDYTHFRAVGSERADLQAAWRRLFRASHLALFLVAREPGHFGFSTALENPVYATVRWEGQPSDEEIRRHAGEPHRLEGYRRNVEAEVELALRHDVVPVLVTMPLLPERWQSGVLPPGPERVAHYAAVVDRNNAIVREVAARRGALLVDVAPRLATPEFLADDCHFTPTGEDALARALAKALAGPLMQRAVAARADGS